MVHVEMSKPDQFGQCHPTETPEVLKAKLKEFHDELSKLPLKSRDSLIKADIKCPELLNDDFKLRFLRCEVFHADRAAKRYIKYWNKRIQIFGPEKAFLPVTQDGMFADNEGALALGLATALSVKDPAGRGVVLFDPSKFDSANFSRIQMVQAFWYCVHAALEDDTTQKKGILAVACPKHSTFSQFDRKLDKMIMESIQGCLPARICCIAICHPPSFFRVIWPIVKLFMSDRMRKRVRVLCGSDESVVKELESVGLMKEQVPEVIGGTLKVDHVAWVEARKKAGK